MSQRGKKNMQICFKLSFLFYHLPLDSNSEIVPWNYSIKNIIKFADLLLITLFFVCIADIKCSMFRPPGPNITNFSHKTCLQKSNVIITIRSWGELFYLCLCYKKHNDGEVSGTATFLFVKQIILFKQRLFVTENMIIQ